MKTPPARSSPAFAGWSGKHSAGSATDGTPGDANSVALAGLTRDDYALRDAERPLANFFASGVLASNAGSASLPITVTAPLSTLTSAGSRNQVSGSRAVNQDRIASVCSLIPLHNYSFSKIQTSKFAPTRGGVEQ